MKKITNSLVAFASELRQIRGTNVWTFIMYGLLFDMGNNLWRPFANVFLERIGGEEFHFALLSALPGLVAAIVLMPGAILFRKITNQKRATAVFILLSRAILLSIALIPTLPAPLRPLLFVVLVAIMNFPDALSQTSLQSFLGSVFSGQMRGQAIAMRTKFGQALIPVVTISSGLMITFLPSTDQQRMVLYQIFFVAAFLLGVVEVFIFNKLQVPEYMQQQPTAAAPEESTFALIKGIVRDRNFLLFLIPTIIFAFTWQAAWPIIGIFQVITLEATEMWFAIFALISGITAFLSGPFWQKLLATKGNDTTFIVAALLITSNIFVFPFVPNVQVMALVSILTGFSAVGINTTLLNGVLNATPEKNRMTYLAFFNTIMNLSLFLAPLLSNVIREHTGLINAMFVIGVMRILAVGLVWFSHKIKKRAV